MKHLGKANLIEVPKQDFGFCELPEHAGETFLEAFPQLTKKYNPQALEKALNGDFYFDEEGVLIGSNSLIPILMNQHNLFPKEEHLLSLAEFGKAHNENQAVFRGAYQDIGIIIRATDSPFSQSLYDQIKKRGIIPTQEEPIAISLTNLELRQDQGSKYGFMPEIKDDVSLIVASAYGKRENIETFTLYDAQGIPIPSKLGDKRIWKSSAGVARVYSGSDLGAFSNYSRLAYSDSDGRVAVGSFVPQNYIEVTNAIQEGENQIAKIKKDLEARVAKL